jgi:hypothetical protein
MESGLNIAKCVKILEKKTTKTWEFWKIGIALTQSTPVKFVAWRRCVYFNPMKMRFNIDLRESNCGTYITISAKKIDFPSIFIKIWIFLFLIPSAILLGKLSFDAIFTDIGEDDARYLFLFAIPFAAVAGWIIILIFNQMAKNDMEAIKKFLNENLDTSGNQH